MGLILAFVISNGGLLLRGKFPMPGLIVVMVPLMVMMTMGLGLMGAYQMESKSIPASPRWLELKVEDDNNWNRIKACIFERGVCDDAMLRGVQVIRTFPSVQVLYIYIYISILLYSYFP